MRLLFRYLAARWRHRGAPAKRFMQAGFGLERRAQHLSVFWREHISRTRAAQARWAQTCLQSDDSLDVLTVLGAGPLFDFNHVPLAKCFRRFRLVDANPLAQMSWGRLNVPVEPVITDVSNCMTPWSQALQRFHGPWDETLRLLERIALEPVAAYAPATDAVLSLNLLSQLEVGWQELVEPLLCRRFGGAFVAEHEQEWLHSLRPGSQALVEQHLAALEATGARDILLITDLDYVEYKGRSYSVDRLEEAPLRWTGSRWQADVGIEFELIPALEGVRLDGATLDRWLPSHRLEWSDEWLWHIAPNGTETTDYGKLHRVGAFAFTQRDFSSGRSVSG